MNIHVHRFGDKVAVAMIPHDGETVYLTPEEAKDFATVLRSYAVNIKATGFTDSQIGNAVIEVPKPKH